MSISRRTSRSAARWGRGLLLVLVMATARADDPLLFSIGTTTEHNGQTWAYLLWQATDPALLDGAPLAVYQKDGAIGAPGIFQPRGVVQRLTDTRRTELAVQRAIPLGEDPATLEQDLDALFTEFQTGPALSLAEKLANAVLSSGSDPAYLDNLRFLARRHPAVGIALGEAHALPMQPSTITTFEIRRYDPATRTAGAVLGRLELDPAQVAALPAPTGLAEVPDASPRGHLNVRLRWDLSPEFLRMSLLNFGFDVYRMPEAWALANNFHLSPPGSAALQNPNVTRVNRLPLLIDDENPGPGGAYAIDDNDRFAAAGLPLVDGQRVYYFVVGLDVLGRPGAVSQGLAVTACDRVAPIPPLRVQARRAPAFGGGNQPYQVEVAWHQNPDTPGDETAHYFVYRWNGLDDPGFRDANALLHQVAGPLPHQPGQAWQRWVDTSLTDADIESQFFYTVQAADEGACGDNLSGHSAPAGVSIRDTEGPEAPTGDIFINCLTPVAETAGVFVESEETENDRLDFLVRCTLSGSHTNTIEWAEFAVDPQTSDPPDRANLGRYAFVPGTTRVQSLPLRFPGTSTKVYFFWCRVGSINGKVSEWVLQAVQEVPDASWIRIDFSGHAELDRVALSETCSEHYEPPGTVSGPGSFAPPTFDIVLGDDTYEWRIYARVDGGPLMLVRQGTGLPNTTIEDLEAQAGQYLHCAEVRYYLQTFDENSNPSPLTLLGTLNLAGMEPQPEPVQALELVSAGTETNPVMKVRWYASPHGVERFELRLGVLGGTAFIPDSPALARDNTIGPVFINVVVDGTSELAVLSTYVTPRIGNGFGQADDSFFEIDVPVPANQTWLAMVRPVGACAGGSWSPPMHFKWLPGIPFDPLNVPWPARPLPPVNGNAYPQVGAHYLRQSDYTSAVALDTVGIRIGEVHWPGEPASQTKGHYPLPTGSPPESWLYASARGEQSLLPFVLYRYQVPSTLYPKVSGDVIQVSPLIESFATTNEPGGLVCRDPYLIFLPPEDNQDSSVHYMYFRDTHGMITGVTYQYLIAFFSADREIKRVMKLPTVEIPNP